MDFVSRLIALIFFSITGAAFAASCPSSYYALGTGGPNGSVALTVGSNDIAALTQACQAMNAQWQAAGNTSVTNGSLVSKCGYWSNGVWTYLGGTSVSVYLQKRFQAPNGQWVSTDPGTCQPVTCPSGKELDDETGQCVCSSIVNAGKFMVPGDVYQGCNNGCRVTLRDGWFDKTANVTWGNWMQGPQACSSGEPSVLDGADPKVEAAKQCASGTCPGTVNGQSVCVPCDKSKQTDTTSSTTSSSSTASGATSATTTSETGSTTSQTSCSGGSCTTTTTSTTVGPTGEKVDKTTTKTEPQSDYCTQNPKAAVCKGSESSWGGSCGSFSCDGDAVTCAIAQASWKSACAIDIDETDPKVTAGQAAMSGGDRPGDHPGNSPEQNAFTANIDQTNPFSSECPADIPLDVMGQSIAIPLSHACDSLKFMGQIAVAFAMLGAAFIVFGGIKG